MAEAQSAAVEPQRPNMLVYLVDTLRADGLGAYGNSIVQTPALDQMAAEGALFEKAFAQSSWTRASVASILTANYPPAHGAERRHAMLSEHATLLSERLKEHGYRTGFITTNPNVGSFFGFGQGFDDVIELYERRETGRVQARELSTPADEVIPRAEEWIDSGNEPFLLVVLTIDPHGPYVPLPEFDRYGGDYSGEAQGTRQWIDREDLTDADKQRIRSLYFAEITFSDHVMAGFVDHLRERDLYDRTILVFASDHGEEFWEHGRRGHGDSLSDESTHIPLVIRYPKRIPAGTRISEIVQSIDIVPTLFDLAGLPAPDGVDGHALFARASAGEAESFASLRLDRERKLFSVRTADWKLVWDLNDDSRVLYDLRNGDETQDVIAEQPEVATRLQNRLDRYARDSRQHFQNTHGRDTPIIANPNRVPEAQRVLLKELGYIEDDDE